MKLNLLSVCLLSLAGCALQPTYQGPTLGKAVNDCYMADRMTAKLSQCVLSTFNKHSPRWKEDPNHLVVVSYLAATDSLGSLVAAGKITEREALLESSEHLLKIMKSK